MLGVMLDLETFGTRPGAVIIQLGAVIFIEKNLINAFDERINMDSSVAAGFMLEPSAIAWWMLQDEKARTDLFRPSESIHQVLSDFSQFLRSIPEVWTLWGNGADFDNVLLAEAYKKTCISMPWQQRQNRCYRTIKNLYPEFSIERTGTHHNALEDAKSQALHLQQILAATNTKIA